MWSKGTYDMAALTNKGSNVKLNKWLKALDKMVEDVLPTAHDWWDWCEMKDLNRRESVVLGLLHAYGKEILRTKLVKMTYLLDNLHFEQVGKTMTGYDYHWDYYGPNAVGNAIIDTLSKLRTKGLVSDTQKLTSFETFANY